MALLLGVDAGGTHTTFVLAEDGTELARSVVGTIKRMRTDHATASANLDQAVAELAARSGRPLQHLEATCVGAAGYTVPLVADWLHENFAARLPGQFHLVGDVQIALDAAFFGAPGALVLAGTGSNVAGRLATGEIITVGGWGPALSDQASGNNIGRSGLRAAVLQRDEEGASPLLEALLHFWDLPDFQALVAFANAHPAPDLSKLSPLVVEFARAGDRVARAVLQREAADMAHLAGIVLARIVASTGPAVPPRLAFAGSVMQHVHLLRDGIVDLVRSTFPDLQAVPNTVEPVQGALWRARTLVEAAAR